MQGNTITLLSTKIFTITVGLTYLSHDYYSGDNLT